MHLFPRIPLSASKANLIILTHFPSLPILLHFFCNTQTPKALNLCT